MILWNEGSIKPVHINARSKNHQLPFSSLKIIVRKTQSQILQIQTELLKFGSM